jgi:diacylglycerol kinase (ATP)
MRRSRLVSFNDAIEGIVYAVRTQVNIRIHFYVAALVFILSGVVGLSRTDFLLVTLVIGFVLATELINTAVEGSVDLIADHYHPLAKVIKDMAAGAVLVAAMVAVITGFLIFYGRLTDPLLQGVTLVKRAPAHIALVALVVIVILVMTGKARFGTGTPLAGGMPSGHAAVSFGIFTAVALNTNNPLIILLAFILALMVSHSRLIYRIHTLREVVVGALMGAAVTLLLFRVFR